VLSSFLALFQELTRLDAAAAVALAQRAQQGAARQERAVIDPTPLREALNALPGQEFKLGERSLMLRIEGRRVILDFTV
jgi:hypothetical protein